MTDFAPAPAHRRPAAPPAAATEHVPEARAETVIAHPGGAAYAWAGLRLTLGGIFFWAFLDKLFGLGFATKPEAAWIRGGHPTFGFLSLGSKGPFADFYRSIAGHAFVDALFMVGLAAIGAALLAGVGVRVAGYSGALMMALMWSAVLPPANNPVLDDHVVYGIALVGLAHARAGRTLGLGRWWMGRAIVRRFPLLE